MPTEEQAIVPVAKGPQPGAARWRRGRRRGRCRQRAQIISPRGKSARFVWRGEASAPGQQLQLLGPVVQRLPELSGEAFEDLLVVTVREPHAAKVPEDLLHGVDAIRLVVLEA